jgi:pepF/M3 family oligoendopeptidase
MNEADRLALPVWKLSTIYPGLDSDEYRRESALLRSKTEELDRLVTQDPTRNPGNWLLQVLKAREEVHSLYEELSSYVRIIYTTDTQNERTLKALNAIEEAVLPVKRASVQFRNALARIRGQLPALFEEEPFLQAREFFLWEELLNQSHQMSEAEEDLAADLSRPGIGAWSRLQQALSSTVRAVWNEESGETKTVIELRSMAYDPDRSIREKAYRKELETWARLEIPLAFALNGVKGFATSLDKRRTYEDSLEQAIVQARITRRALDALIQTMGESLPIFRRYLRAKARVLGIPHAAFFDLFAPVGSAIRQWPYGEATAYISRLFDEFSIELGDFARNAFANGWIDAQPREGKVGGAYCSSFPRSRESRILCNFDGAYSAVTTLAHELGHGFHHHVLKDAPLPHQDYPMTLAETASIFAESIVFNGTLATCTPDERLTLIEGFLQDATQVIVDILSRFKFESAVFERRASAELSPREFCDLMLDAQKATYGDGLDSGLLHPYMWAVKGHYYRQDISFYNFPYAFGLLFGLGLYAQYQDRGASFVPQYRELLAYTGRANAVDVVKRAGFDIEEQDFWRSGIGIIAARVKEFEELVG